MASFEIDIRTSSSESSAGCVLGSDHRLAVGRATPRPHEVAPWRRIDALVTTRNMSTSDLLLVTLEELVIDL